MKTVVCLDAGAAVLFRFLLARVKVAFFSARETLRRRETRRHLPSDFRANDVGCCRGHGLGDLRNAQRSWGNRRLCGVGLLALLLNDSLVKPIWGASPETLEPRVEKLEDGIGVARKSFLANLQRWRNSIVKSKHSPDMKRELSSVVVSAMRGFERDNDLPDHPALIPLSYSYAKSTQRIMLDAEKLRQDIVAEGLRSEGTFGVAQIRQLERRVEAIIEGSDSFRPGSEWHGKRTYLGGDSQGIHIFIDKVVGNQFTGRLRQSYQNGTSDVMEIAGMRVGSDVGFRTTGMNLGAGRNLKFDGALVGSRLFAQVSGTAASGKPASGFISTTR